MLTAQSTACCCDARNAWCRMMQNDGALLLSSAEWCVTCVTWATRATRATWVRLRAVLFPNRGGIEAETELWNADHSSINPATLHRSKDSFEICRPGSPKLPCCPAVLRGRLCS